MNRAAFLDVVERTIRTAIQASAGAVLALWIEAGSFANLDWTLMWQVAAFTTGLSFLMALAGTQVASNNDASFTNESNTPSEGP